MRVGVIGGGPAGMTAALQLARGGAEVTVYEASDTVGGLARSFDLWGQRVDLGPHRFFSTDARVNRLWLEVVGRDYQMVERLTRLYYRGKLFRYPLKPLDVLSKLGPVQAALCLASYARERLQPSYPGRQDESFETWVVDRFGRRLFETFFKTYSEKLWGRPSQELSADFAAQRIRKLSLGAALKAALLPGHAAGHRTLIDRFAYPVHGTGSVYVRMAEMIRQAGGAVELRMPVRRVLHHDHKVTGVELFDGRQKSHDQVISTMPLTLLVNGLGDLSADIAAAVDALVFRNTILIYLHVDSERLFPDQWIYVNSPELRLGRVTNFRNWAAELNRGARTTILAAEFWCDGHEPLWSADDPHLVAQATDELRSTGLLGDAAVLAGHVVRVPRCYPVYAQGYQQPLSRVIDHVRTFAGLTPLGRYGAFKYNNQDHSILMGILAAENLLEGRGHDLWAVNTDYETYGDDTLITEDGLNAEPVPA
jgi:protoporphyrinogen oxidase